MLGLLVQLILIVLILGVFWWIITLLPLPHPIPLVLQVLLGLILVILLLDMLLGFGGAGNRLLWRHG